uniref:SH3 domain-containing protein n=1 Tax=Arion vulgaris TaxID=1028688 RepID=A0A0B6YY99_9EUPU
MSSNKDKQSTVPSGLEMCSPQVTPTSPPYTNARGHLEEDREENDENFDGGWSSGEFSNSDEETAVQYISNIEPSYKEHFVSLGDYFVVDPTELGLAEGDEVEVTRVGTNGWWYARHLRTCQEGWVPSTFLEPVSRAPSLYSSSDSLCVAGTRSELTRTSSSSYFRTNSPVPETTV